MTWCKRCALHLGSPQECAVKGLAVKEFGQGVALAVVQQTLQVFKQVQYAVNQGLAVGRHGILGLDFKQAAAAGLGVDRKDGGARACLLYTSRCV